MRHNRVNRPGDLHKHVITCAPAKGIETGCTFRARVQQVTLDRGKVVIQWAIWKGGK